MSNAEVTAAAGVHLNTVINFYCIIKLIPKRMILGKNRIYISKGMDLLIIAKAPTLLHITDGIIDEFYLDSPDIKESFENVG